ncbi:MAG: anthranilate synthase component I [Lentisphaeraceae bacterium]|nr:anthranilate synthase component I [Lentisphaeraceae bacterium]
MYYPKLEEVRALAKQGNYIPIYCEVLADMETPVSAFHKISYDEKGNKKPYAFLLESVEGGENIGRFSFLGCDPLYMLVQHGDVADILKDGEKIETLSGESSFTNLREFLKRFKQVKVEGLAPFNGGAVGYSSFETIEQIEPKVKCQKEDGLDVPDAIYQITDTLLAFDRVKNTIQIISHVDLTNTDDVDIAYKAAAQKIDDILGMLHKQPTLPPARALKTTQPLPHTSNMTRDEFKEIVVKAKDYIVDGDIIQVVLSQRFEADLDIPPLQVHRALRAINPSPYMYCLHLGDDFSIAGTSPEIHARCMDKKITVRPIAGTRKRGKTPELDQALADELLADPKERAEHIMLVDLARNDVGRIAKTGSIEIPNLMTIEKYSHVMHIVSDVTGVLKDELESSETMCSTFPAGTVSGAPKIRAMQIISELEKSKRGPYAGTIAYFSFDGSVDSCITIRTVIMKDKKAYIQAGAGVVADSDPDFEFEETQNKAKAMLVALNAAKEMTEL